jgi:hypothetical protein
VHASVLFGACTAVVARRAFGSWPSGNLHTPALARTLERRLPTVPAAMESDIVVLDLVRALALRCPDWQEPARETLNVLGKLLGNIAEKPEDASRRRIRVANPKVKHALVDAPGVVEFLQRHCGFKREHLVADASKELRAMNEMVLTCTASDTSKLRALAEAISACSVDHMFFTEAVKVALPSGPELRGGFSEFETIADVRSWIARMRTDAAQKGVWPELGAAWDPARVFGDDTTVREANLHKNKLLVRLTGDLGDQARAMMEQVEAERRVRAAAERERQVAKARSATAGKADKRSEQTRLRESNVSQFKEDREYAEQRAARVVAQAARAAAPSGSSSADAASRGPPKVVAPLSEPRREDEVVASARLKDE